MSSIRTPRPLPPIGFDLPPDSAEPSAPLWVSVLLAGGIACGILGLASYDMTVQLLSPPRAVQEINLKFEGRYGDAAYAAANCVSPAVIDAHGNAARKSLSPQELTR